MVRRIYRMALDGTGWLKLRRPRCGWDCQPDLLLAQQRYKQGWLQKHRRTHKMGAHHNQEDFDHAGILRDVINFKSYSKSYKMKRRIENPEENRAIFLNVHEPIIDRPTWEKVQALKAGHGASAPPLPKSPASFPAI